MSTYYRITDQARYDIGNAMRILLRSHPDDEPCLYIARLLRAVYNDSRAIDASQYIELPNLDESRPLSADPDEVTP